MYLPVRSTVYGQILNRFLFFHDKLSHLQQQIETVRSFETPRVRRQHENVPVDRIYIVRRRWQPDAEGGYQAAVYRQLYSHGRTVQIRGVSEKDRDVRRSVRPCLFLIQFCSYSHSIVEGGFEEMS